MVKIVLNPMHPQRCERWKRQPYQQHRQPCAYSGQVIDLDTKWRESRSRIDFLNKDRNRYQKEVTKAKKAGGEDPENAAKIKEVAKEVKIVEAKMGENDSSGVWVLYFWCCSLVCWVYQPPRCVCVVVGERWCPLLAIFVGNGTHQTNGLVSTLLPFGSPSAEVV